MKLVSSGSCCQAALLAVAIVALGGCSTRPPPQLEPGATPSATEVELERVVLHRFRGDRLESRARAERATLDRAASEIEAEGVHVESFGHDGRPSTAVAERAVAELGSTRTILSGNVRIVDRAGRILETERVEHDGAADRVRMPEQVRIRGENFSATGTTLDAERATGRVHVDGPIRARVK